MFRRVSDQPRTVCVEGRFLQYFDKKHDSKMESHVYEETVKCLKRKSDRSIWTQVVIPENGKMRFDIATLYGSYNTERTLVVIEYDGPHHFESNDGEFRKRDIQKARTLLENYCSFIVRLECDKESIGKHISNAFRKVASLRKECGYKNFSDLDISKRVYFSNPEMYSWHPGYVSPQTAKEEREIVVEMNQGKCEICSLY